MSFAVLDTFNTIPELQTFMKLVDIHYRVGPTYLAIGDRHGPRGNEEELVYSFQGGSVSRTKNVIRRILCERHGEASTSA